jgi:hypothetical protein
MQPRTRIGLIVGVIGLVLTSCVATFAGFCGPFVSLLAGGVAGFLAAQQEKPPVKGDGARIGAISGGIAGGLIILGQVIGAVAALVLVQNAGVEVPFGQVPPPSSDPGTQMVFYGSGMVTGLCFGVVGALLAAGAGAGAGYFATPDRPITPPSQDIIS